MIMINFKDSSRVQPSAPYPTQCLTTTDGTSTILSLKHVVIVTRGQSVDLSKVLSSIILAFLLTSHQFSGFFHDVLLLGVYHRERGDLSPVPFDMQKGQ